MSEAREQQPEASGGDPSDIKAGSGALGGPIVEEKKPNPILTFLRRLFREKPLGTIGLALVVLLLLVKVLPQVSLLS